MTSDNIKNLSKLLARMREEDPDFRVFGADHHKYRLGEPLSESQLQTFEQQYSVALPADYRFFLKEAGNGGVIRSSAPFVAINAGAGPSCGVMPLEEAIIGSNLRVQFPLTKDIDSETVPGIECWGHEEEYPGVLEICYHGSAILSYLVVNGPAYGTLWIADVDVRNFTQEAASFDEWYGKWMRRLEEYALPRLANERKITAASIGMTKAEIIALYGGEWTQRPFGAGKFFLSFNHLSTQFELDNAEIVTRIIAQHISC
jgi:hypothetical protein